MFPFPLNNEHTRESNYLRKWGRTGRVFGLPPFFYGFLLRTNVTRVTLNKVLGPNFFVSDSHKTIYKTVCTMCWCLLSSGLSRQTRDYFID